MKKIMLLLAACMMATANTYSQTPSFARGADLSWSTEMEASGMKFYNRDGQQTELFALMAQTGMNAVRLRVWVNPSAAYGPWSDKADVLIKARRAKAIGQALLIDFHYSDFFADPGRQDKPAAWAGYSMEQLKQAISDHTTDVLSALKDEGIEPAWVQVGNETRQGMLWDSGKIDWSKSGTAAWEGYVALSNAGYDAVKSIFPQAAVIVHIDRGPEDNAWFYQQFKNAGGKFDMIGLSHYPETNTWQTQNQQTASNIKTLHQQFGVPVMVVETGFYASNETLAKQVMTDFLSQAKAADGCNGVFYWEPEVYGGWRPQYYVSLKWNSYDKGAFTAEGRPSAALDAFYDANDAILTPFLSAAEGNNIAYDILGRPVSITANNQQIIPNKGLYISNEKKLLLSGKSF